MCCRYKSTIKLLVPKIDTCMAKMSVFIPEPKVWSDRFDNIANKTIEKFLKTIG